jgi:hypothetical protein
MTNGITLATSSQSDIPFILPLSISHFISVAVCTSKDKQLAESLFRCNYICVFLFCNPRHKVGSSGHLTLIRHVNFLPRSLRLQQQAAASSPQSHQYSLSVSTTISDLIISKFIVWTTNLIK